MKKFKTVLITAMAIALLAVSYGIAQAGESPEQVFAKWYKAVKDVDVEKFDKYSSKITIEKVNKGANNNKPGKPTKEQKKNYLNFLSVLISKDVPSYTVENKDVKGDVALLTLAIKPDRKKIVKLVKEGGRWKVLRFPKVKK